MKILACHNHYQQRGGEDESFEAEARLLEARGHTVIRYTLHNDAAKDMGRLQLAATTFWNASAHREVTAIIDREKPDVMHCQNTFPLLSPAIYDAAHKRGVPIVQTLRNYRLLCSNGLLLRNGKACHDCVGNRTQWRGVMHGCYRNDCAATAVVAGMVAAHRAIGTWNKITRCITLSQFAKNIFVSSDMPLPPITVKPNFIDPDPTPGSGGGDYAMFAGRLSEEKGVAVLLDAWKHLRSDLRLIIFGDGPMRRDVEAATKRDPRITWRGRQPLAQITEALGDACCAIVPSTCYETFGRSVIEAFACGTPAIVSDHGALAELVDDGVTGRRFTPGDSKDLAQKITRLTGDPALLASARRAARAAYEARYTADANYHQLIAIYEQVINESRANNNPKRGRIIRMVQHLPRFRRAAAKLNTLADRETWSRSDIEAFQLQRLNEVWQHAIHHVPYYASLQTQQNLPDKFTSLDEYTQRMPLLQKATVRQRHGEFLSDQRVPGRWFRSGGSTGTPVSFFWSHENYREILACRYRFHEMYGVDMFDRTAFVWGHRGHLDTGIRRAINQTKQRILDRLRNRIRLSAYKIDPASMREGLRRIIQFQPVAIYGFTTAVRMLAREAAAAGKKCDALKMITMTTEPVHPHIAREVEEAFGVPAVVEYGACECGAIAFEHPDRTLRVREDVVFVETLPQPDGSHDIAITVLNNPHFPLMRYCINDITETPLIKPDQGFAIINGIGGRNDEVLIAADGKHIHPAMIEGLFEHHPNCRGYRVHQHGDGSLDVQFALSDQAIPVDEDALKQSIADALNGATVKLNIVEHIEQTPGGKHRRLSSALAR